MGRKSLAFDENTTKERLKRIKKEKSSDQLNELEVSLPHIHKTRSFKTQNKPFSCPSAQVLHWEGEKESSENAVEIQSELRQWPVQLHLVPPGAPYFKNADLLIVADCVPISYPNFHQDFLKNHAITIGCPKLDNTEAYIEKIAQIIKISNPKSIKVLHMEVGCCFGLIQIVQQAMEKVRKKILFETVKISIKGEKLS